MCEHPFVVNSTGSDRYEVCCPTLLRGRFFVTAPNSKLAQIEAYRLLISAAVSLVCEASAR